MARPGAVGLTPPAQFRLLIGGGIMKRTGALGLLGRAYARHNRQVRVTSHLLKKVGTRQFLEGVVVNHLPA